MQFGSDRSDQSIRSICTFSKWDIMKKLVDVLMFSIVAVSRLPSQILLEPGQKGHSLVHLLQHIDATLSIDARVYCLGHDSSAFKTRDSGPRF